MPPEPRKRLTIEDVQAAYDKALMLADRDIIRLIAATVLANQSKGAPVWLLIVSNSSGGKSALLMTLDGLEFLKGKRMTFFISDLTENTLASGFKSSTNDSSLLMQVPVGGMFIFKDLTSLLTKRREARDAIMGQLREVYDRKFDKKTGNNQNIEWKGKIGALGGVTEAVYEYLAEMSIMGDRFIMYSMRQPNRIEATKFVMDMKVSGVNQEELMEGAKTVMHEYLTQNRNIMNAATLDISMEDQASLIKVADFVTKVRSGVIEDVRTGMVTFVPSAEMPFRLIDQLMSIGTALSGLKKEETGDGRLAPEDMNLLFKIALDSIPIKRRWALKWITKYRQGATTASIASFVGYETDIVKGWLAQLTALGVARRLKNAGRGDMWVLNEEYVDIMVRFEKIEIVEEPLYKAGDDPDAEIRGKYTDDDFAPSTF